MTRSVYTMIQLTVSPRSIKPAQLAELLLDGAEDDLLVMEELHFAILKGEESGLDLGRGIQNAFYN